MISYDIYKNRIRRIAAVKNFIVRFRVLFLILLALVVGLISAFLATKGMIIGDLVLPEGVTYGESFTIEPAKALFSGARLEYAYLGVPETDGRARSLAATSAAKTESYEWTREKPVLAGNYLVRTVTDKSFGKGYGTPVAFEIQPRSVEFLIRSDSVVYGSNPGDYIFPLVNGDVLSVEGLSFVFDSFETDLTDVCANAQSFAIYNAKGEDVTFCYDITTPKKEITLLNKPLTLIPSAPEYVYSGKPIVYESAVNETTLAGLNGDIAHVTTIVKDGNGNVLDRMPVEAGTYTVEIDPEQTVIYNGETDVTARYNLSYRAAEFVIGRRPITVATASITKEYDGAPLSSAQYSQEGLAEGHTLVATGILPAITAAGTRSNAYEFRITDEYGNDVTKNYAPEYDYGTLEVTRRIVSLKTASAQKIYDGTPLTKTEYTISKEGAAALVAGHRIAVRDAAGITFVSESGADNVLSLVVYGEDGRDVTENYSFVAEWGTLTVNRRALTVTAGSQSWEYDGTVHRYTRAVTGDNLVAGETLEVRAYAEITDAGETDNGIVPAVVSQKYGDTTENYEFTYVFGKLTVTPRAVEITTATSTLVYNGEPQSDAGYTDYHVASGGAERGLVLSHVLVAGYVTELTDANSAERNVCNYSSVIDPVTGEDVSQNYTVRVVGYGTLWIVPRPIVVQTPTAEHEYDGTAFTATEDFRIVGEYGLVLDHYLMSDRTGAAPSSVTNVSEGTVENRVSYKVADPDMNMTVNANYTITYRYGTIRVTPRRVLVTTADDSRVYSGAAWSNAAYTAKHIASNGAQSAFVLNHTLRTDSAAEITFVRETPKSNVCGYTVVDGRGTSVNQNYELSYVYGTLSVTLRPLTITTATLQKIYDGAPLYGFSEPDGSVITGTPARFEGLADGEYPARFSWTQQKDVRYAANGAVASQENVTVYDIAAGIGGTTTENYEITYRNGTLTVQPRPITIQTATIEREYNGQVLSDSEGRITRGSLVSGETLLAYGNIPSLLDVGSVANEITYYIERPYPDPILGNYITEDSTFNYAITYDYGTLTVIPRPITVQTESEEWIYDGTYHSSIRTCEIWYQASPDAEREDGLVSRDQKILVKGGYSRILDVGSTKNVYELRIAEPVPDGADYDFTVSDGDTGASVRVREITDNYAISYEYGTLTVKPRPVTIHTPTASGEYNGEPFSATEGWSVTGEYGGLVEGHSLTVKEGTSPATVTDVSEGRVANVVEYDVTDGTGSVSRNYTVTYDYGEIWVTARIVVVTTASNSWVYKAAPYSDASYTAKHFVTGSEENAFVLDHTLRAVSVTEITFVSESPKENVCSYNVVDAKGALVNRNYALIYEYGALSITTRPITVTTSTFEKVYDGQYLYGNVSPLTGQDEAVAVNLAGSDRIAAIADTAASMLDVYYPYWIDVDGVHVRPDYSKIGSIRNITQYAVYDGTTDRSDNYTITYVYGKLTITPRPLTITNPTREKEYDGKPLYGYEGDPGQLQYTGLVSGEELIAEQIAQITDVDEVENDTTYLIFRHDYRMGTTETTHNYTITYTAGAKLKVTPRPIEVETESQSWVYDGTDKKCTKDFEVRYYLPDGSTEYGFVFEYHEIVTLKQTTIRNVGSVLNEHEVLIGEEMDEPLETEPDFAGVDKWGDRHYYRDITKNYSITWVCGTLTVTPRPITLEVDSQTKVYDGTPLPQNPKIARWSPKDDPDAGLAVDSDHVIDGGEFEGSQTDVGSSKLNLSGFKIYVIDYNTGEYLEEVTSNYAITYVPGTLTVTPRPITITAVGQSKVYDGNPLPENPQVKIGYSSPQRFALVSGHAAVDYTFAGTQTNVGESALSVSGARIVERDESGKEVRDVTFNYEITYAKGKLTVTARPITITTGSDTKIYDGAPFTKTDGYIWQESNGEAYEGLIAGHTVSVDRDKEIASVTYVEDNREGNNVLEFLIYSGTEDVTGNYDITVEYGTISITKRKAAITTATLEKVYDGAALRGAAEPDGTVVTGSAAVFENFVSGETYTATEKTVYDVQRNDANGVIPVVNDTVYRFFTQREGTLRDTTANYEIEYEYGTLKVTPRKLTVTTPSISRPYNGEPLLGTEGEAAFEGLAEGEFAEAKLVESIIDVGSKTNGTLYDNYTVREGEKISTYWNYDRSYEFGTLEITPREITVTTASLTKTYDGQYLYGDSQPNGTTVTGSAATFANLAAGETPEAYGIANLIDFGSKQNTTAYRFYAVRDGKTVETTDNYKVTRVYGQLKIERRSLTIATATLEKVYDGAALFGDSLPNGAEIAGSAAAFGNLVTGETYEAYGISELTDVAYESGTVCGIGNETQYRLYAVRDGERTETTDNYVISYVHGTLTVTPRPIVTHTAGDSWEYDGDPHQLLKGFYADNLLSGHSIVLDVSRQSEFASVLDVADGKVVNRLYFNVTEAGADENRNAVVNGNYFAEREEFGILEITPHALTVSTISLKKTYDGEPLYGDGRNEADEIVRALASSGLVKDDTIRADAENVSSLIDAITENNQTQYRVYALRGGTETDITANYDIVYNYGTLTVERRRITVTTPTAERVYDASPYTETEGARADDLVSGHTLAPDNSRKGEFTWVTNVYERNENGELVRAIKDNVVYYLVYDAEGNPVTDNYKIEYELGKISVSPRKIHVTTGSTEHEYDGKPFRYGEGVSADNLATETHRLVPVDPDLLPAVTNVTDENNRAGNNIFECLVVRGAGDNVTDISYNYTITGYTYGTVRVIPRKIAVSSEEASKTYDGTELSNPVYSATRLVTELGHKLKAQNNPVTLLDVGREENANVFEIVDGAGNPVTANYDIVETNWGILEITPRELLFVLDSVSGCTYGDPFGGYDTQTWGNYASVTGALASEPIRLAVYYTSDEAGTLRVSPKDAGVYFVWIEDAVVRRNGEEMPASNYTLVQTDESRFEIRKRKLSVQLGAAGTGGKIYDGEAYLFPNDNYMLINGTSFAPGETLTIGVAYYDVTRGRAVEAPVNAGTYRISLNPETCLINGEVKATLNYELECEEAVSYEIAKRGFTVRLENAEKVYDGAVYDYERDGKQILTSGILDGDTFSGSVYYTLDGAKIDPVFADTYAICFAEGAGEWKITSGNRDVSENYALESASGAELGIAKREVRVSVFFAGSEDSAKLLREYSGEAISVPERSYVSESVYGEGFVSREGIRDDLRVLPVYTYTQYGAEVIPVERGSYAVNVAFNDADLLHNYELSYDSGVLEIITRCVTVKADTSVYEGLEYDGGTLDLSLLDYLDYHKGNPAEIGFLNADDRTHYTASYRIFCGGEEYDPREVLQAGDYTVSVTLTVQSGFDQGYVIDYEDAYFTVAPRPVTLKAHDLTVTYSKQNIDPALNGYTHTYAGTSGGAGFVGTDEELAVAEYFYSVGTAAVTPIDAGEYLISVSVTDESGYLLRNYRFAAESGTLTIEKRKIVIVPEKYEELYVSTAQVIVLPETNWSAELGELAEGDILRVLGDGVLRASQGKSVKVGIAAISITDSATGEDMAKNYDAIYRYTADCGVRESKFSVKLSFAARKVEVWQKVPPQSVIPYTGQSVDIPFRGNGEELFELVEGSGDGLLAGHRLYVAAANTGNTPGVVSKWLKRMGVLDESGRDVSEFYDVTISYDESSQIVLQAIPVTVTVYADIALYKEGAEVTDPQLFEVSGRLLTGHIVKVFVENGAFVAHVYESGIDKQRDKYYEVVTLTASREGV